MNPKMKFILSPQEKRQGPRLKVSSEGQSPEIDILYTVTHPNSNRARQCFTQPCQQNVNCLTSMKMVIIMRTICLPIVMEIGNWLWPYRPFNLAWKDKQTLYKLSIPFTFLGRCMPSLGIYANMQNFQQNKKMQLKKMTFQDNDVYF